MKLFSFYFIFPAWLDFEFLLPSCVCLEVANLTVDGRIGIHVDTILGGRLELFLAVVQIGRIVGLDHHWVRLVIVIAVVAVIVAVVIAVDDHVRGFHIFDCVDIAHSSIISA